jgi:quercetin 2,3-dioxygenase
VLDGGLEHRDNLGNGSVIVPGEVQKMSAGRGIRHSEVNASESELVHLLQIWMEPTELGLDPYYDQRTFSHRDRLGQLRLVADSRGAPDTIALHTDARLYASVLAPGARLEYENPPDRHVWLQVAGGEVTLNGMPMVAGDGAAISQPGGLLVDASAGADLLLFDLG